MFSVDYPKRGATEDALVARYCLRGMGSARLECFAGGDLDKLRSNAAVEGVVTGMDGTEVLEHYVEHNDVEKSWRLSMLAKPAKGKSMALRAFLRQQERTLTETWTYRLPSRNNIMISEK